MPDHWSMFIPELALIGAGVLCVVVALLARSRWTLISGGTLVASVFWLEARCGGAANVMAAARWMKSDFSEFGVLLPLAVLMGSAALWMIAVPVEAACRGRLPGRGIAALWVVVGPAAAGVFLLQSLRVIVDQAGSIAGWSVWQDTIAQFCLPVGAAAAVLCQAAACRSRQPDRAACWTAAACGGWVLMAAGRADGGGWTIGGSMLFVQSLALAGWLLGAAGRWRWMRAAGPGLFLPAAIGTAAALGLAGLWPMEGSFLSRLGLIRGMGAGGFGMAWDTALAAACGLSWVLALVTWLPWAWLCARSIGRAKN